MFIVLEGPDGAGTTTHSKRLAEVLEGEGRVVVLTAEPSDGPIGTEIRAALKSGKTFSPDLLQKRFTEDRADHLRRIVEPSLRVGKTVICDRYIPSTLTYGEALGANVKELKKLNEDFLQPDLTLYLLPPFQTCMERLSRRAERDSLENEALQKKVYDAYVKIAQNASASAIIDTSESKETVAGKILNFTREALVKKNAEV